MQFSIPPPAVREGSGQPLWVARIASNSCATDTAGIRGPTRSTEVRQLYAGEAGVLRPSQIIAAVLMWAGPLCFACLAPLQTYAYARHALAALYCAMRKVQARDVLGSDVFSLAPNVPPERRHFRRMSGRMLKLL